MFNLNLATTAANAVNNLLVDSTCTTPRTPEILNSLIAMTNPLDNYTFTKSTISTTTTTTAATTTTTLSTIAPPTNMSSDSNSSSSSQLESPTTNPPSVQHTCSQLIKAGLKLSIEQKRKHHQNDTSSGGEDLLDLDKCKKIKRNECSESEEDRNKQDGIQNRTHYQNDCFRLTPEDEERRRRRRERNKIAATKCRLKKREKTQNLIAESETLDAQNIDLKSQLQELQNQKRTLIEMLTLHRPHCQHNIPQATRDSIYRLPALIDNGVTTTATTTATAVAAATTTTTINNIDMNYNRQINYTRTNYAKPPSIIVEDVNDYHAPHLTNLDNPINNYYNNQCHSYNSNQNYNATGLDNGCMA